MKKNSFFRTAVAATLLTSSLLFTNCEGPQGEAGPQGEIGETGASGSQGPKGEAGTANVLQYNFAGPSSTENPYEWKYFLRNLPSGVSVSNSVFIVYVLPPGVNPGQNWWMPLPSILRSNYTQNRPGFYRSYAGVGTTVHIQRVSMDGTGQPIPDIPMFAARILVVPAAVLNNGRYSAEFFNNYRAVQKEFNLPD